MEQRLGPGFARQSGYRVVGTPGGSVELADEIKGRVRRADVFVSASPSADEALTGRANGDWIGWYVTFATSPLVLGYDPNSRFAAQLRSRPWYTVVGRPGFLLGRTDPLLDPKGALSARALAQAAARTGDHALLLSERDVAGVFPEQTLLGRLESGQLDAAFLYAHEAKAAGVPTVSLAPVEESTAFTVAVLAHTPHRAGALAFVRYLLSPSVGKMLAAAGFEIHGAQVHGSDAPSSLRLATGAS
jgi:molybdate/tungstate transport system substrate-binding protein